MELKLYIWTGSKYWIFETGHLCSVDEEYNQPDVQVRPRTGIPVLIADTTKRYPIGLGLNIPRKYLTQIASNDTGDKVKLGPALHLYSHYEKTVMYVLTRDYSKLPDVVGKAYEGYLQNFDEYLRPYYYVAADADAQSTALPDGPPGRFELFVEQDGAWIPDLYTDLTGDNNDLCYTALTNAGIVTITYVDPGAPDQSLSVGVSGTDVTVNLATSSGGAIISTGREVMRAVNEDAQAKLIILARLKWGNNGLGVVTAMTTQVVLLGWGTQDPENEGVNWVTR